MAPVGGLGEVGHAPGRPCTCRSVDEVAEDVGAVGRVGDLGVELDAVEGDGGVGGSDGGVWAGGCGGDGLESGGFEGLDLVAVGHPDGGVLGDGVEEVGAVGDVEVCAAELAVVGAVDVCAEHAAGELHAVADAEDGDAEGEEVGVAGGCAGLVDAGGAAGEDDALGLHGGEFVEGGVGGEEDGKGAGLADAAGDELGGLGTEVEDRDDLIVRQLHAADSSGGVRWGKRRG